MEAVLTKIWINTFVEMRKEVKLVHLCGFHVNACCLVDRAASRSGYDWADEQQRQQQLFWLSQRLREWWWQQQQWRRARCPTTFKPDLSQPPPCGQRRSRPAAGQQPANEHTSWVSQVHTSLYWQKVFVHAFVLLCWGRRALIKY